MASKSKIVLVTGSSRGLGKNMAEQLAEKGLDVIITYHSKKEEAAAVSTGSGSERTKSGSIATRCRKTIFFPFICK